ncbi:MAG TPA: nucleoside monophosphate kinase [Candidatus Paceibacterota bacterium]|nr:nucleoside monophosphate kinase [Candidatus Paceibacterota bacterium]
MKIALVGPGGAGKDTLSEFAAAEFDLKHVSCGDMLRYHVVENNLGTPDRLTLRVVATHLRAEKGADYLVRKAIEMHPDGLVLSGLRAAAEAEAFKKLGGTIISVTAPMEKRFEWVRKRPDIDNEMSYEKFLERDTIESSNPDPNAPNIAAVMSHADIHINNDSDKETLFLKFRQAMSSLLS